MNRARPVALRNWILLQVAESGFLWKTELIRAEIKSRSPVMTMRRSSPFFVLNRNARFGIFLLALVLLLAGFSSTTPLSKAKSATSGYYKLKKETGVFHYDKNKEENYLKGVMWKQYQKVPISPSSYAMEKVTFLRDAETVVVVDEETFTTQRDSATGYYEEGGVGYALVPDELEEHRLTMYKVKVLTGDAAGKEGWVFEAHLGARTVKPRDSARSVSGKPEEGDAASTTSPSSPPRKGLFIVRLKSGKTITSKYYKEMNGTVTLMQGGRILKFPKSEITSVKDIGR